MLKWKIFRLKPVAIGWLILISILFFLPGSALPKENWFDKIYIDKWVHVGLFAVLIFLWRSSFNWDINSYNLFLLLTAVLYGFLVEVVQLYWIPNRSFDMYDVLSDASGSIVGLLVWLGVYRKNKPL
jgi:VanZ family protein